MEPLIVYSYLPDEEPFYSERFEVLPLLCESRFDYSEGLAGVWDLDRTLVNVEHDMRVSDDLIQRILDDSHPLVTYAYTLFWASTRSKEHYAQRMNYGEWVREGAESADYSGIGFARIDPEVRTGPLGRSTWQHVDVEVNKVVAGRWAILWPEVFHDHF
jgi:hypothetical protein